MLTESKIEILVIIIIFLAIFINKKNMIKIDIILYIIV